MTEQADIGTGPTVEAAELRWEDRFTCPEPEIGALWKARVAAVITEHDASDMNGLPMEVRDRLHEELRLTYMERRNRR